MMLLGGLQGLSGSYGKGSQNSTAKDTANKESTVFAGRTVSIESGKDTDIIGSHVKEERPALGRRTRLYHRDGETERSVQRC